MPPILDTPDVLQYLFHPRKDLGYPYSTPETRIIFVEVDSQVVVGGRLYPAGSSSPVIILFHGNGEIAADYDDISQFYRQIGVSLVVWDYRGYGLSMGIPTSSCLIEDSIILINQTDKICRENGLNPVRLYIMGRSLGSAAAIEAVLHSNDYFSGLIIESGFSETFPLLSRLGVKIEGVNEKNDGFGNLIKVTKVNLPILIIHGEADMLIPPKDAKDLYVSCGSDSKKLVLIPEGKHNDLMFVGLERYFEAIRAFVYQKDID
jgi:alpha-beta hydrolase superfamily lysophospholipase